MDLGIAGRKALVCAASKGLGRGCAEALAQAGVDVTILARTRDDVQKAARDNACGAAQQISGHRRCCEQNRNRQSDVESGGQKRLQSDRRSCLKDEVEETQQDSRLHE